MDTRDEVVLALTDDTDTDSSSSGLHSPSTQRLALIGHYVFRVTALLIYLFCSWFTSSFVLPFIFVLVCLSLDFWVVKNISGRVLVGLRWSSYIDDQGRIQWRFDSRKPSPLETADPITLSRRELAARSLRAHFVRLFWVGLIGAPIMWSVLILAAVFSLNLRWALVSCIAFGMTAANLYGYLRCRFSNLNESTSNMYMWIRSKTAENILTNIFSGAKPSQPTPQSDAGKSDTTLV